MVPTGGLLKLTFICLKYRLLPPRKLTPDLSKPPLRPQPVTRNRGWDTGLRSPSIYTPLQERDPLEYVSSTRSFVCSVCVTTQVQLCPGVSFTSPSLVQWFRWTRQKILRNLKFKHQQHKIRSTDTDTGMNLRPRNVYSSSLHSGVPPGL